jgi:hypothetical protein
MAAEISGRGAASWSGIVPRARLVLGIQSLDFAGGNDVELSMTFFIKKNSFQASSPGWPQLSAELSPMA